MKPHGADGVLATKEYTIEIGLMHRVPVLQTRMLRVMPHGAVLKSGDTRIVHQDVQPAALLQDLRRHSQPIFFPPHIKAQIAGAITE